MRGGGGVLLLLLEGRRGERCEFCVYYSRLAVIIIVIRLLTLTERATKILVY